MDGCGRVVNFYVLHKVIVHVKQCLGSDIFLIEYISGRRTLFDLFYKIKFILYLYKDNKSNFIVHILY